MFTDRIDAGRRLARRLEYLKDEKPVILGLPRGGVPVAYEVAAALDAPLDVIVVRKLGVPFHPELAMGAIGENGVRIISGDVVASAAVSEDEIAAVEVRERAELERRAQRFRGERVPVALKGRTVVVVDDGIATGATARAACRVARAHGAERVVLAVPVAPPGFDVMFVGDADETICLEAPHGMFAISQAYRDFTQTTDDDVLACLEQRPVVAVNSAPARSGPASRDPSYLEEPPGDESLVAAREEAEGVELFEDPDAVLPADALREGAPGHETFTAEQVGEERDAGEETREHTDA